MKQLEVQIMQQSYLLGCPEGREARLLDAVERVDTARILDGRYLLERPLAGGNMAVLWAATHQVGYRAMLETWLRGMRQERGAQGAGGRSLHGGDSTRGPRGGRATIARLR